MGMCAFISRSGGSKYDSKMRLTLEQNVEITSGLSKRIKQLPRTIFISFDLCDDTDIQEMYDRLSHEPLLSKCVI